MIVRKILFIVTLYGLFLSIDPCRSGVTISWDPVTLDITGAPEAEVISYWIYCETFPQFTPGPENFLVSTTLTSYQHESPNYDDPDFTYYYVVIAVDLWGNRSDYSTVVPQVEYVLADLKIMMEGPFEEPSNTMGTALDSAGIIPLSSPYASAPRLIPYTVVPDSIVDWILVELRSEATGAAVAQQSYLLKSDCTITETDGKTHPIGITDVIPGQYFIVLRHRNHLAVMTSNPLSLNSTDFSTWDFTAGADRFYGETGFIDIRSTGIWGMVGGNADFSGSIDQADHTSIWNDRNRIGYYNSDVLMDGRVNAGDRALSWNNRGYTSAVP
jgi:hypothetical protein